MSNPWSWKTVFETLLGTGVGACVGVGGLWWQSHRESNERYEDRLANALAGVFKEISVYANSSTYKIDYYDVRDFDLIAAVDIALMVATDVDLTMIRLIKRDIYAIRELSNDYKRAGLSELSADISDWRSKEGLSKEERHTRYYKRIEKLIAKHEKTASPEGEAV